MYSELGRVADGLPDRYELRSTYLSVSRHTQTHPRMVRNDYGSRTEPGLRRLHIPCWWRRQPGHLPELAVQMTPADKVEQDQRRDAARVIVNS